MVKHIRYRHIAENAGGVLTFSNKDLSYVSTHSCITCVGVYMPMSQSIGETGTSNETQKPSHAFCAHINAFVPSTYFGVVVRIGISPEEGRKIKLKTLQKRQKSAEDHNWSPADVDLKRTILVCPRLYENDEDGEVRRRPGWYVVDAILDFLGRSQGLLCDSSSQGLAVNHRNGRIWKIEAALPSEYKHLGIYEHSNERFSAVAESLDEKWKVVIRRSDGR